MAAARSNASLFETDKINARIPDPTLPGFNTLGGNQQVQGFELMLQGKITGRLECLAGL